MSDHHLTGRLTDRGRMRHRGRHSPNVDSGEDQRCLGCNDKCISRQAGLGVSTAPKEHSWARVWAEERGQSGLLRSDIGRNGKIAILKPLHADLRACFVVPELIQIGHENLQTGLRSHASIAVHKLFLIVSEV
jgi:hypothetical protein